jgi:signal transduction histidine kinase
MIAVRSETVETNGRFSRQSGASNSALREACERKDRFIAVAGHELRNVLSPIVTALDVLLASSQDEMQKELLTIAAQNTWQLSRLIDDLFEASRFASGKVQLRNDTIDVRNVVERSIKVVTPAIQERKQELLISLCEDSIWLNADPLRLEQVFLNLLNNAIKYTPEGGCIWLQLRNENGSAVFQLRDSGCGIQPELLPHIFDFFSQGEDGNGVASSGGLGIGLAMVKSLVELHGGTVHAHSDGQDCGADFTVRLPALAAVRSAESQRMGR